MSNVHYNFLSCPFKLVPLVWGTVPPNGKPKKIFLLTFFILEQELTFLFFISRWLRIPPQEGQAG